MPRVVHFEIHATDPDRIAAFYSGLFGWTIQKWEGPVDYWLITTGPPEEPGINGGLVRRRGAAPTYGQAVNAYACTVDVESAQDALTRAVGLGGAVALPLMPVPGVGWLGYATDPDGNLFGVMQRDPSAA
jgi:predicted enzyme related to lactoylglutathione lyase